MIRRELACLLSVLSLVSCAKSIEPLPNKNTNWLRDCIDDSSCAGALSCICGVCTKRCDAMRECGAEGDNVACNPIETAAQCSGVDDVQSVSICIATCEKTRECSQLGADFVCSAGACVKSAEPVDDAGRDPDASDAGDAGGDGSMTSTTPDASMDSGPNMPTTCGNGTVDPGEDCDGTAALPFGRCEDCKLACDTSSGECNVELLASGQAVPYSVAVDATHLYWTNWGTYDQLGNQLKNGGVMAMPLDGGPVVTLASDERFAMSITVDAEYAYWTLLATNARNDGKVMRVALAGGSPEAVADGLPYTTGIAVDDTYVYFFSVIDEDTQEQGLYRVSKDGSESPEQLTDGGAIYSANGLVLEDGVLYWMSWEEIRSVAVDGTGMRTLTNSGDRSGGGNMTLHGDSVYWVAHDYVETIPKAGGEALVIGKSTDDSPTGIAADDDYVYWSYERPLPVAERAFTHVIARADNRPGMTTELLVDPAIERAQLVVTATHLYIVAAGSQDHPSGVVLRMPK